MSIYWFLSEREDVETIVLSGLFVVICRCRIRQSLWTYHRCRKLRRIGLMIITKCVGRRLVHCFLGLSWNGFKRRRSHFLDEHLFADVHVDRIELLSISFCLGCWINTGTLWCSSLLYCWRLCATMTAYCWGFLFLSRTLLFYFLHHQISCSKPIYV